MVDTPATTKPPILSAQNLTVTVDGGRELLKDVSFEIHDKEIVGLLGPNGSGKTSLLRCLYGSQSQYQGDIYLNEKRLSELSAKDRARQIAAVTQESFADFQLTVEAVIRTGRTPHQHWLTGLDSNAESVIRKNIERFNLQHHLHRDISELSGGERKRVLLCRALIQEPNILLLDEPCNHLDISSQLNLLQQLRDLRIGCLISLHDFTQAVRFCDRLLVLEQGRIVSSGNAKTALSDEVFTDIFSIHANTYNNPWQAWSFYPLPLKTKRRPLINF